MKISTVVLGNKAKLKCASLTLLRCTSKFEIFKPGLIAVRIGLALLPCTSVPKNLHFCFIYDDTRIISVFTI